MVPITSTRRVRWSKCGRVQISPQAWRVIRSMNSALNAFLLAIDLSTQASEHLASLRHAVIAALLIVHGGFLLSLRAQRSNPVRRAKKEWIASSLHSSQ